VEVEKVEVNVWVQRLLTSGNLKKKNIIKKNKQRKPQKQQLLLKHSNRKDERYYLEKLEQLKVAKEKIHKIHERYGKRSEANGSENALQSDMLIIY